MNPYLLLAAAITAELFGTTALKLSQGFSRPIASVGVLVGYGLAFYLLSLTITDLPLGLVYGTWAGIGIVGAAVIGVAVFGESVDMAGIAGITLIVIGVYALNVLSGMAAH